MGKGLINRIKILDSYFIEECLCFDLNDCILTFYSSKRTTFFRMGF
jgi:hypothetical protein